MNIHERIIKSRNQAGLTQSQLAIYAGLKQSQISQYESGSRSPSSKSLLQIAAALNVSPDYLLYGQESSEILLNDDDKVLLKNFKKLPPEAKRSVLDFISYMSNKNDK